MHIYIYVCMYIYVYIYIHVYKYIYIYSVPHASRALEKPPVFAPLRTEIYNMLICVRI